MISIELFGLVIFMFNGYSHLLYKNRMQEVTVVETPKQTVFQEDKFLQELNSVFEKTEATQKALEFYSKHLIPFEVSLRSRSVPGGNDSDTKSTIELLSKLEKVEVDLKDTKAKYEFARENLELTTFDKERLEAENKILKISLFDAESNISTLTTSLNDKLKAIETSEKDKKELIDQVQTRSNEYNLLFESYMRDKNIIATKLNEVNEMEERVIEREKRLEQDKFFLQNQKMKFQEDKKNYIPVNKQKVPEIFKNKSDPNKLLTYQEYQNNLKKEQEQTKKQSKKDIARTPLKKNIKHHNAQIYCISSSYNGNVLATCGGDRLIKFYDPLNLKTISSVQSNSPQSVFVSIYMNYLGDKVIAGSTDKTVSIWDVNQAKQLNSFSGHGEKVNAVVFTNVKQKCASGSNDRQLKIWDIEKGSNTLSVNCGRSVKVITPNYSEPVVYTGLADGSIRIYSINQGNNPMSQIKGLIDFPITSITLSSNRNQVLVGSQEGSSLMILDLRTNKLLKKYEDSEFFNANENFRADYSPSQKYILAGNNGGTILYWNVETEKRETKLVGHEGTVTSVVYQPFTGIMSSADTKGNLILWS